MKRHCTPRECAASRIQIGGALLQLPQLYCLVIRKKLLVCGSSLRRKGVYWTLCPTFWLFSKPVGMAAFSPVSEHGWDLSYSRCLEATENQKSWMACLLLQRTPATPDRSWYSLKQKFLSQGGTEGERRGNRYPLLQMLRRRVPEGLVSCSS